MSTSEHPYYDELSGFLRSALEWIERELQQQPTAYGGDRTAQRILSQQNIERINALHAAQRELFVARIDMVEDGISETLYIGKQALPQQKIYSWAADLASRLYYRPDESAAQRADVIFDVGVDGNAITAITNRYVSPTRAGELQPSQLGDSLLMQLMSRGKGALRDIVATIQADQDRVIRTERNRLLLVQGVPGSGKTSIALHRVAYLLFHHRKDGLAANRILILGPNRLFLGHIAQILPSLGERQVPQRTFDEWTAELLGDRLVTESVEASLEQLLNPELSPARRAMHYHAARAKGSLEMGELLDRYVTVLAGQVAERLNEPLSCRFSLRALRRESVTAERGVEQMRALLSSLSELPLNRQRDRFEELLARDLVREVEPQLTAAARQNGARDLDTAQQRELSEDAEKQVRQYLLTRWARENTVVAYRRLLRTPQLLRTLGSSPLFSERDIEYLLEDAPTAQQPLRSADLAALMYLKIRLDGLEGNGYEHIVIDEAQDLSPLHYRVLRWYSSNQSLTVVGDVGQTIYSHQGSGDWELISEALSGKRRDSAVTSVTLTRSYRSTRQILQYAAQVLRRVGLTEGPQIEPFRDGPAVGVRATVDEDAYLADLTATLAEARSEWTSVALTAKTAAACEQLHGQLLAAGVTDVQLLTDRQQQYAGGTVLLPGYLTKGMEFDAVIVVDADAANYPADALHARLLYVALTRAAHRLAVRACGLLTPLLDEQRGQIPMVPLLQGALGKQLTTVAQHAAALTRPADWYIEQLAQQDRLHLLQRGLIERGLLQVLIDERATPPAGDGDDDEQLPELAAALAEQLTRTALQVAAEADEQTQLERTATALVFGLARNVLRMLGGEINDERQAYDAQVRLLALLLPAGRQERQIESGARWTTAQAVLTQIPAGQQAQGQLWLDGLTAAGVLETRLAGGRAQLRIAAGWVGRLVQYALGQTLADDGGLAAVLPRQTTSYAGIVDGSGAV
jgi:DNA helicase-2/ATP-dependent DNA helicase PcrA